jgi:hypothetical protein
LNTARFCLVWFGALTRLRIPAGISLLGSGRNRFFAGGENHMHHLPRREFILQGSVALGALAFFH